MSERKKNMKKVLEGIVVSDKTDKTAIVKVSYRVKHSVYGKIITRSKKFMIHDENNECKNGYFVRIMETRPLSKRKRWRLTEILKKSE